jgi:Tfp pilus assembly protein PilV
MKISVFDNSGAAFSLIELMIASAVLLMGVGAVMSMVLFALSANYAARVDSAALRLSEQKLEELKSLPMDDSRLLGPGNALDSEADIDFAVSVDPAYTSTVSLSLNKTKNTVLDFETRWNVSAQSGRKIITVATRRTKGNLYPVKPVNLKVVRSP